VDTLFYIMCMDSAKIERFKNVDGALREYNGHWCSTRCPVCWVFSAEGAQESLFDGDTLEYGNVYLLHAIATLGCRFAKDIMERLALTTRGEVSLSFPFTMVPERARFRTSTDNL
jgi:hypothetical protein